METQILKPFCSTVSYDIPVWCDERLFSLGHSLDDLNEEEKHFLNWLVGMASILKMKSNIRKNKSGYLAAQGIELFKVFNRYKK